MTPNASVPARTVVLAGATGLVGGCCLRALEADPGVARIVALSRRPVDLAPAGKTRLAVVDLERPAEAAALFAGADQLFVCLGTTRKLAGSAEAFVRVDHDLVLALARQAAEQGVRDLFLVSTQGASPRSPVLYLRTKGRVEAAVRGLGFRSVHLFRPAILLGRRSAPRPGERLLERLDPLLGAVLIGPLARARPIAAATVARAMVAAAAAPGSGVRVWTSAAIRRLGAPGPGPAAGEAA